MEAASLCRSKVPTDQHHFCTHQRLETSSSSFQLTGVLGPSSLPRSNAGNSAAKLRPTKQVPSVPYASGQTRTAKVGKSNAASQKPIHCLLKYEHFTSYGLSHSPSHSLTGFRVKPARCSLAQPPGAKQRLYSLSLRLPGQKLAPHR
jgi:hypothetical protein